MNDRRTRVLVVDDDHDSADVLALLLTMCGYDARACYGGVEALAAARGFRPHAVVLDVAMPGGDGLGVARRLRERPGSSGAVIVGVSGYSDEGDRARAAAAGFDHYLAKPADPEALLALLARVPAARAPLPDPRYGAFGRRPSHAGRPRPSGDGPTAVGRPAAPAR
jgi:CheY-like chemotaxis protein